MVHSASEIHNMVSKLTTIYYIVNRFTMLYIYSIKLSVKFSNLTYEMNGRKEANVVKPIQFSETQQQFASISISFVLLVIRYT